jgi:hypothetical protein
MIRIFRGLFLGALAAMVPVSAFAVYNANGQFVIAGVLTYADTDAIYIVVAAPPSHSGCANTHFVIAGAIPADRRKAMLARLLLAKATGEVLNLGYDATGDCAEGYIRVHRVG